MDAAGSTSLDPDEYIGALRVACKRRNIPLRWLPAEGDIRLPAFTAGAPGQPAVHLSAGIHGDEPAGPLAIRQALQDGIFDRGGCWTVYPMLNPTGFRLGTREAAGGKDINRDYRSRETGEARAHIADLARTAGRRFVTSLSLHEDWEARGAYLYEHNPRQLPSPGPALLACLREHFGLEPAAEIDGWPVAAPGLIHPPSDSEFRDPWPEQIFLLSAHTDQSYTVETPSTLPLSQRIAGHLACLRVAAEFLRSLQDKRANPGRRPALKTGTPPER